MAEKVPTELFLGKRDNGSPAFFSPGWNTLLIPVVHTELWWINGFLLVQEKQGAVNLK